MSSKRVLRVFVFGILLICMIAVVHHITSIVNLFPLRTLLSFGPSEEILKRNTKKLSGLQLIEPSQFDIQLDVKCVNANLGNLSFPMCIYNPQNDIYISKLVISGHYFESDLVQKILNFFLMHSDVSFVDIGANLGTYTLPIAHSGIHVVSVEPNRDTVRRLAKSVHLGRIENNVDIFNYALSNEETTTLLKFDAANRGDTFFADNGSCTGCMSAKVTVLNKLIPFVRHKRAFIKIDTQEAEIMIFQPKSAGKFLTEIDVVMIQMEWGLYPKRYGKTNDERRKVDHFLEFFYQRGYDVYDPRTEKKLDTNWTRWTFDILFKKEDLPKNYLFLI